MSHFSTKIENEDALVPVCEQHWRQHFAVQFENTNSKEHLSF